MQGGHHIAYESSKLNDTKKRHIMQEFGNIIPFGSTLVVKTNNITTSYFQSQKKLSSKQARWQDCLSLTVLEWQGQPCFQYIKSGGKHATFTQAQDEPLDMICEGMRHDPLAMNLVNMVEKKTKRFLIEDNLF